MKETFKEENARVMVFWKNVKYVLEKFMSRLVQNRVMGHKELRTLSKYQLILARDQFRKNPPPNIKAGTQFYMIRCSPQQGMLEGDFALCISLYHGYELLMQMGLRSLFFYIQGIMDGSREMSRARNELQRTPIFMDLYREMEAMFVKPSAGSGPQEVSTRVMIFSSFRESVQEIAAMLNRHAPLIRVMTFMGQASAGKGVKGFTQKEQLEVVHRFRQGGFNTLVSTCVGEEGLDIGEVDLIVCFDAQKNPIRLVQRMGRTGRKRQGRIVVILAEGREERKEVSKSGPPPRELSLWEWRHWQHKALPTHVVDHSLRCHHFVKVMELIDGMREENEGECRYEQELLPYLHKADGHVKNGQKKPKSTKTKTTNNKPKPSRITFSDLKCIDEEAETKQRLPVPLPVPRDTEAPNDNITDHPGPEAIYPRPSNNDCPESDMDVDFVSINEDVIKSEHPVNEPLNLDRISQLMTNIDEDEDVELKAMFYLPKWDSPPPPSSAKLCLGRDESLKVILANVAELLSRSPPSLTEDLGSDMAAKSLPPSPLRPHQPFHVSFTLDVDDDEDEVLMSCSGNASPRADSNEPPVDEEDGKIYHDWPHQEQRRSVSSRGSVAADSPTWDEVFGQEEENDNHDMRDTNMETGDEVFKEGWVGKKESEIKHKNQSMTEEKEGCWRDGGVKDDRHPHIDDSMDLFGDDEAFLQMTIPDISTPGVTPRTSPRAGDIHRKAKMSNTSHTHTPTTSFNTAHTAESERRLNTAHDLTGITPHAKLITQDTNTHSSTDNKHHSHTPAASKPVTNSSMTAQCKSPTVQRNSDSFSSPQDYFPINFELGYSLEDSEEEDVPAPRTLISPQPKMPAVSDSSTPYNSFHRLRKPPQSSDPNFSTPQVQSEHRKREPSSLLASPFMSKGGALPSPISSPGVRRTPLPGCAGPRTPSLLSSLKRRRLEGHAAETESTRQGSVRGADSPPHPVEIISDSEDDVVVPKKKRNQNNLLSSLEVTDEMEGEAASDDDFQNESVFTRRTAAAERQQVQRGKAKHDVRRKARQFLDEEAELSEEDDGADVSSDEEDGEEEDHSLGGFVVDNTHCSQGLNGTNIMVIPRHGFNGSSVECLSSESEMHGVYLKSVRSPAVQGKFKMSYRNHHNMDIFSQVPEMDETYAEDSFVVGSDVEEMESSEEEAEDIKLIPEDSYVDGKRQYATRRRVFLHKARARVGAKTTDEAPPERRAGVKTKRPRVIRMDDSSEEETEAVSKKGTLNTRGGVADTMWPKVAEQQKPSSASSSSSIASKVSLLSKAQRRSVVEDQQKERCRQRLENQHLLSDELDFTESEMLLSSKKQPQDSSVVAPSTAVCILVDSRCISSGVELISSLRQRHAATVHVCSLDGSYFIVSNRMAVERYSQSDLAATQNRKRLAERVNSLQGLFERVCLIVEKDRTKPGEVSRPFQRTQHYDGTLTALVRAGVRLLWSSDVGESAGLLADLAKLEQRKGQGIAVPLEVKGQHRQQALQLYLSLPSVNYVHALSLSHNFKSIAQLINSSIEAIQRGGCMSRSRAEEIYCFLRYSC
ncbi:Fanconi anemia group M protein [Collichthys lucidus]|uniref:Fanconi anemia group M protein n=1 Tax=Collichthys lucidus TaxID=240159 RepID=A0A4U5VG27_COLLU|nr:Fanconi anemia group M protein [Collichthys lucidus]